jgi:hypothetical protein
MCPEERLKRTFSTNKVVPRRNIGRDLERNLATVLVHLVGTPPLGAPISIESVLDQAMI